ncbi:hypothetical protein [Peribacillus loiseleuriae]|uniref:Uncharacterized protein n=1 Tax=Peribacillus loiseleuriae TaxID=1679170 RepID=A0A0K9GUE5_9BACI|nr:hypothetical protein [Peribacillus loiseleuriae]KMY50309.1 hypothetical protein AC625_13045 [Peribacillus loiseleuriae]
MKERKVYLLFTDTGTNFTKLIKLFTKQPYNHVSISFDGELREIFSFGRKKHDNPFIGGFVREQIAVGLFKKARCELYSFKVSELDYERMLCKVKQIEAEKNLYKYNLLGLFAILLNINFKRKNAFFCSQFVAMILNEKKHVIDKSPNMVTPQNLLALNSLELVYKGKLHLFPYQTKEIAGINNLELSFRSDFIGNAVDIS